MAAEEKTGKMDGLYQRSGHGKEHILRQLRQRGFRVTRQREVILDTILNHDCTSCKEIYYQAVMKDPGIGMATVYRMVNTLTDIGILKVASLKPADVMNAGEGACVVTMKDNSTLTLSQKELLELLKASVESRGYSEEDIARVEIV